MQQIQCKMCGAGIPAENINLDRMLAKCKYCNTVFSLANMFHTPQSSETAPQRPKLDVPLPASLQVQDTGFELKIIRRWFTLSTLALTFFAVFWNGFMLVWFGISIASKMWPMALFGSLHGAIGLGLIYAVVTGYLNSTTITVTPLSLDIKHGPIPALGNKTLNCDDIKQVYCKQHISRGENSTSVTYEVKVITRDDKEQKLVSNLPESEQALYLEQEIERFLKIQDVAVRGDYKG